MNEENDILEELPEHIQARTQQVIIDDKTSIFIRADEDPDVARQQYLDKRKPEPEPDEGKTKRCSKCKTIKDVKNFHKEGLTKGRKNICKICVEDAEDAVNNRDLRTGLAKIEEKLCGKCSKFLPVKDFNKNIKSQDGYHSYCRECNREYVRSFRPAKTKDKPEKSNKLTNKDVEKAGTKFCTLCQEDKPLNRFGKNSKMRDGYINQCKDCMNARFYKQRDAKNGKERTENATSSGNWNTEKDVEIPIKPITSQKCGKCEEEKQLGEFPVHKHDDSWILPYCKSCIEAIPKPQKVVEEIVEEAVEEPVTDNIEKQIQEYDEHIEFLEEQEDEYSVQLLALKTKKTANFKKLMKMYKLRKKLKEQIHTPARYEWLPYEEAKELAQTFGITSIPSWKLFCREGNRPDNIPANPQNIYNEFEGFPEFFGYEPTHRVMPYEEAQRWVQENVSKEYQTSRGWDEWAKENGLPDGIPWSPKKSYKDKGWISWPDWFGAEDNTKSNYKKCGICKERKRKTEFKTDNRLKDKRSKYCLECRP